MSTGTVWGKAAARDLRDKGNSPHCDKIPSKHGELGHIIISRGGHRQSCDISQKVCKFPLAFLVDFVIMELEEEEKSSITVKPRRTL